MLVAKTWLTLSEEVCHKKEPKHSCKGVLRICMGSNSDIEHDNGFRRWRAPKRYALRVTDMKL